MTYHWYARFRLAQLMKQLRAHHALCADCNRRFLCTEYDMLRTKIKHYQKVNAA